jgi:hypothetical protein
MNGLRLKNRGLAQRISAGRGPMTGSGATRLLYRLYRQRTVDYDLANPPDGKRRKK